jgi:hypothetical protein
MEIPHEWKEYYKMKGRDIYDPKANPDPVSSLLQELDAATVNMLNNAGSPQRVEDLFETVLKHPDSRWTKETLNYRQRQLHYK